MHIWWFRDGRAGHERQAMALIDALRRLRPVTVLEAGPVGVADLARAVFGRLWPAEASPDLLLGVGHQTHLGLLAARRARGGRAVVIMRPTLPLAWFDLCVLPRHDRPPKRDGVTETLGPLSPVQPGVERDGPGLILVGGPSRHFRWDAGRLREQIRAVATADPDRRWLLATSRRTPATLLNDRDGALPAGVTPVPVEDVAPGWLDEQLPRARACLVTPDSLSMIFDALTAGVPCGVFELEPRGRGSRVTRAVDALLAEGRVGRAADVAGGDALPAPAPLAQADTVAEAIVGRWFP